MKQKSGVTVQKNEFHKMDKTLRVRRSDKIDTTWAANNLDLAEGGLSRAIKVMSPFVFLEV